MADSSRHSPPARALALQRSHSARSGLRRFNRRASFTGTDRGTGSDRPLARKTHSAASALRKTSTTNPNYGAIMAGNCFMLQSTIRLNNCEFPVLVPRRRSTPGGIVRVVHSSTKSRKFWKVRIACSNPAIHKSCSGSFLRSCWNCTSFALNRSRFTFLACAIRMP